MTRRPPRDHTKRDCTCPRVRHEHGTVRAYTRDRCGCFKCRLAHAAAAASYRAGGNWREAQYAPSVGVRRRLQALAVIGYTARDIAERLNMSVDYVAKIRTCTDHAGIATDTAAAVIRIYDELWDKPLNTVNARRCATMANRFRWLPPLAWDDDTIDDINYKPTGTFRSGQADAQNAIDEVAVAEACVGRIPAARLNKAELDAVIDELTRRGYSADEIAQRLDVTKRTIVRHRSALRDETSLNDELTTSMDDQPELFGLTPAAPELEETAA